MKIRFKKVEIISLAKLQAIIGCIIGLSLGILYSFGGLIIDTLVTLQWITSDETPGLSFGTVLAFGALIGMPLIFLVLGFLLGIIEAVIINLSSKWIGEYSLDVE